MKIFPSVALIVLGGTGSTSADKSKLRLAHQQAEQLEKWNEQQTQEDKELKRTKTSCAQLRKDHAQLREDHDFKITEIEALEEEITRLNRIVADLREISKGAQVQIANSHFNEGFPEATRSHVNVTCAEFKHVRGFAAGCQVGSPEYLSGTKDLCLNPGPMGLGLMVYENGPWGPGSPCCMPPRDGFDNPCMIVDEDAPDWGSGDPKGFCEGTYEAEESWVDMYELFEPLDRTYVDGHCFANEELDEAENKNREKEEAF